MIPLFSEPTKGGVIGGYAIATGTPGEDFTGSLHWTRLAASKSTAPYALGFDGQFDVVASQFVPPGATAPVMNGTTYAVVAAGIPAVPNRVSGLFTLDGKKIKFTAPLTAFTIDRTKGSFSGAIKSGNKALPFKGVINQVENSGFGQFIIGGVTGSVEIEIPVL
jgi:hypothetical protein